MITELPIEQDPGRGARSTATSGRHRLAAMCEPRSIALVGASEKSPWSRQVIDNIADLGFDGQTFAVNRTGATVFGVPGFTSCRQIGQDVDLAFVMVGKAAVMDALEDLASSGIRNAVILTAGFSETGEEGARAQAALLARAEELGVLIWGPNTLGFVNVSARTPVSSIPVQRPHLPPSIAIVSQSGSTASELHDYAHSQNIGSSFIAATGNQGGVTLSGVIDYLVDHEPTKAIAAFVENVSDPEAFIEAARRARRAKKPLVLLKIGRTALAGAVAQAHTGSVLGSDAIFNAVCDRLGIVRVDTAEDLINVAGLLAATGPLSRPGLSFLSISGGSCTLVADGAEDYGVSLPPNDPATASRMRAVLPDIASTLNPLDVTGMAITDPDLFERVLPVVAAAPEVGLVAVSMTLPSYEGHGVPAVLAAIGRGVAAVEKPAILVTPCVKTIGDAARKAVNELGLPHVVTGIDAMLRAVSKAVTWSAQVEAGEPCLASLDPQSSARPAHERETLDYLAGYGVPVVPGQIVRSRDEAYEFGVDAQAPLALKIVSPNIAHKTEVGGVLLNVAPEDAASAYETIVGNVKRHRPDAAVEGVVISPMRASEGIELLVSVTVDPRWGPAITVGFGGIFVELLADVAMRPLPVTAEDVTVMLRNLKGARLLQSFRGMAPASEQQLAEAIVRIGEAALGLGPDLAALEINPLRVSGDQVEALDALVLWQMGAAND